MLQFSEYDDLFSNIYCSQPVLDINVEDSNRFIIRYPKFREITHLIFSFDAETGRSHLGLFLRTDDRTQLTIVATRIR